MNPALPLAALLMLVSGDPSSDVAPDADGEASATSSTRPSPAADTAPPSSDTSEMSAPSNDEDDDDPSVGKWGVAVIPRFTINSDDGFGLGLRGSWFWYRWNQKPYKTQVQFQAWMTTRLVQHHYLKLDAIDAFNFPVRLRAEAGYFQSQSQNFCGYGGDVSCDMGFARRVVEAQVSHPAERVRRLQRFYKLRFFRPYAQVNAQYRLVGSRRQGAFKVQGFGGWRGFFYYPGDFFDEDHDGRPDLYPYPGSLYAQTVPGGEKGLASVVQAGILIDGRDNEPAPRRGFFVEASARGSAPYWGSFWWYAGTNLTGRLYLPLGSDDLVLASRAVADVIVGDPPLQEMVRVGGTVDYVAFGGSEFGRGIRVQRYAGRVKLMVQQELRFEIYTIELWGQRLRLGGAAFYDAGYIAESLQTVGRHRHIAMGFGLSGRVAFNDNFVMRLDVAISRDEMFRPGYYNGPGHPF